MPYQISLLDKCPINGEITAHQALHNAARLAQTAESLGFTRFWVAEHHYSHHFASSAPEILVAYLLAKTQSIRIGSGGVMLQHYSPYKVAEIFNVLASLEPDRVDMGIGKTPGGLPASTQALQAEFSNEHRLSFLEKVTLLNQLLGGNELSSGQWQGIAATPKPSIQAQGFLLGASEESAKLAVALGWAMNYAGHLNGSDTNFQKTLSTYQAMTNGSTPIYSLAVIIADTDEEAEQRAEKMFIYKVHFADQRSVSLPTYEAAEAFALQSGEKDYEIEQHKVHIIAGTARSVHQKLLAFHQQYHIQEFMIELPNTTIDERIQAIESLIKAKNHA